MNIIRCKILYLIQRHFWDPLEQLSSVIPFHWNSIKFPAIVIIVGVAIPHVICGFLLDYLELYWWTSETIPTLFHSVNLFIYDINTIDQVHIFTNVEKMKVGTIACIFLCIVLTFDQRLHLFPARVLPANVVSGCFWIVIFSFFFLIVLTVLKSKVDLYFTLRVTKGFFANWFNESTLLRLVDLANSDFLFILILLHAVFFLIQLFFLIVFSKLSRDTKFNENLEELSVKEIIMYLIFSLWGLGFAFLFILLHFDWQMCSYIYTTVKDNQHMPSNGPHWGFLLPHIKETLYQLSLDSVHKIDFWAANKFDCRICNNSDILFEYFKNRSKIEWPRIFTLYVEKGVPGANDLMMSERKQWVVDFYKDSVVPHHQKHIEPKSNVEKFIEHRKQYGEKFFWSAAILYLLSLVVFYLF